MNHLGKVIVAVFAIVGSAHADPPLPVIPTQVFIVTNTAFAGGAYGNGASNNAAAINAAIAYASAQGGGIVEIPPVGVLTNYLSGPITMVSSVNLQIDSGATLQMLPYGTWPSTTPFIDGDALTDVEISGSGTIDGQGTNWWLAYHASGVSRPNFVEFDHCTRVLIQNVTLQNPPTFHIYLKNSDTSVTIQGITINTPHDSPNTDGADISSTNVLIRDCSISTGDDNLEIGGSSAAATDITVSNCTFGTGHGLSIGSKIAAGVNNLTVSNCSWNNTEYGIKIKSDRDIGGLVQNLKYCDLTMTNVNIPIAFYMDYDALGSPSKTISITPSNAAANGPHTITSTTPYFRNITISNLTAVGNRGIQGPGNIAGILYGVPESLVSNVTLSKVNILGRTNEDGTICMYDVTAIQIIDSNLTAPTMGTNTLTLYNAQVTVTNSAPNPNLVTLGGLAVPPTNNVLAFFNTQAAITDIAMIGPNPLLTLGSSTLTVNDNLNLGGASTLNFGVGSNAAEIAVIDNLTLNGTLNVADAGGFTNTAYTLFTYGGALTYNGVTTGTTPNPLFIYTLSTSMVGQVNLIVSNPCPAITLSPSSLPDASPAGSYGQTIGASGGTGSYTYTVNVGTLPTGLSLSSGGVISGTPTAMGSSTFTVLATDTSTGCTGQRSYTLNVVCPTITLSPTGANPTVLNGGTVGTAYSQTISASGGLGTCTFAQTSGTLPTGLSLSSDGMLSGAPTVAGMYTLTVTATDTEGCTGSQAYSIAMICPTLTLSATSATVPARGGSKHVRVKLNGTACSWTAVSNDSFITITSGTSGTGNGNVEYTVSDNLNTVPVIGTMTIAGLTFTVYQAAGGCTYRLSPKRASFTAKGGSGTVKVKPTLGDCAWTAVKNPALSFITITSGTSGVGEGTVSYAIAPNSDTAPQFGSITIGGELFLITQDEVQ